ncbi:hypothetical protein [Symbioplanes lichenis]|uniref:hypothetical protein n=1 Tax=Symbioplanes lichenis TaxID=1629072 RepID=UPI002739EC8D|nr:hypothetical protein [Actinoplanes lichenis]
MSEPDSRFERRVADAFRAEVDRYCVTANATGLHAARLRLHVTVTTWPSLGTGTRRRIFQTLVRNLDAQLPAARVDNVHFDEDAGLPEPGHRFVFRPPAVPLQPRPVAATRPYEKPAPPLFARLTLRYGTGFDWRCHLGAQPGWVPLGRWSVRGERPTGFRLPAYATFVPRGQLVVLRRHGRTLEFARTSARPGYVVRLDGVPLRDDGSPTVAGPAGQLEYVDGSRSSTVIDYHIAWEQEHTVG